jgi:hypothetical protein
MQAAPLVALLLAAPAAGQAGMQPGKWTSTHRIVAITAPGIPADIQKSLAGKTFTTSHCFRADEMAEPEKAMVKASGGTCRYTSFTFRGGQIRATSVCAGPPETRGQVSGTYTPTSYTMRTVASGANGMKSEMVMTGRRVGSCDG